MKDYKSLDFDRVKKIIADYSPIIETKNNILLEELDFNPLVIKRKLDETKEFLNFLKLNKSISFDGIVSPLDILDKTRIGRVLSIQEILDFNTFNNHARRIKTIINSNEELELIKEYSDSIIIDKNISNIIENVIDNSGNVKKDASPELKSIYEEIDNNLNDINEYCSNFIKNNSNYLQENNVCERNNRYVFLFKNTYKNTLEGYDYGTSGSGQASYVEPSSLVRLNNKKNDLEERKNKEIHKILEYVSSLISYIADKYINNFDIIVNISTVYAKAYFGFANEGCVGELGDYLYLENVKHPLIDPIKVVENTYTLNKDKKGIIISGSNTGGKTVSLKVIGLSICMTYLGIPVIASKVIIPLYDNVLVDADSNQSLKDSLSTFSAHLSSINEIMNAATSKSIVLIDELISGTDPKEAESISLSLINRLLDIGSTIIVTTHYGLVKKFAFDREDLLLSSVEFNENTLMPTYKYIENSYGKSNAFDIADRYLDDKQIISNARKILENSKSEEEKVFAEINRKMSEIESIKKDLVERTNELNLKNKELEDKINEFNNSMNQKKNDIINKFNEELDDIRSNITNQMNNAKEKTQLQKLVNSIKDIDTYEFNNKEHEYKVGDRVRVNDIGNPGYIISINGKNAIVDINGLTIKTNLKSLSLLPDLEKKKTYEEKQFYTSPSELVVVGERAEAAINTIDEFIDKARLARLTKIKIIHGVGTLTLKDAIWDYLKKSIYVDKFYSADYYDGGLAATIVELK